MKRRAQKSDAQVISANVAAPRKKVIDGVGPWPRRPLSTSNARPRGMPPGGTRVREVHASRHSSYPQRRSPSAARCRRRAIPASSTHPGRSRSTRGISRARPRVSFPLARRRHKSWLATRRRQRAGGSNRPSFQRRRRQSGRRTRRRRGITGRRAVVAFSFRVIVRRQSTLTSGESETGSHSPRRRVFSPVLLVSCQLDSTRCARSRLGSCLLPLQKIL